MGEPGKARTLLGSFEQRASSALRAHRPQQINLTRGWIALAEQRYDDAVESFRLADVGNCTICALAPPGHAYDLGGQQDSAIAVFERYLTTNYWSRRPLDAQFLASTYKRLGELYDAKGDAERAATYYSRFVDLWKNADPELQPKVVQARRRLAALQRGEKQNQ